MVDLRGSEPKHSCDYDTPSIHSTNSQIILVNNNQPIYLLSKRRWAILLALVVHGICGGLSGETGTILHTYLEILDMTLQEYVYVSQIFMLFNIFATPICSYLIDKHGIKSTMLIVAVLVSIRDMSRALLFNPDLPYWAMLKRIYWVVSVLCGTQVTVIYYCIPLKLSETWFAASERSFAWTAIISAPSIGMSIAAFVLPRFINNVADVKPLFYANIVYMIVTSLFIVLCINRSEPEHPPSERMMKSSITQVSLFDSFKKVIREPNIVLHLMHEVMYLSIFTTVMDLVQDILTSTQHSKVFVGNLVSLCSIVGVVMQVIFSTCIHWFEDTTIICKTASVAVTTLFITHLSTMIYPFQDWTVLLIALILTTFRCWQAPNYNNMTAHLATGIVSQATIAGMVVTSCTIMMSVTRIGIVSLIKKKDGRNDYSLVLLVISAMVIANSLVYCIFFKAKTRATNSDNQSVSETNCDIVQ